MTIYQNCAQVKQNSQQKLDLILLDSFSGQWNKGYNISNSDSNTCFNEYKTTLNNQLSPSSADLFVHVFHSWLSNRFFHLSQNFRSFELCKISKAGHLLFGTVFLRTSSGFASSFEHWLSSLVSHCIKALLLLINRLFPSLSTTSSQNWIQKIPHLMERKDCFFFPQHRPVPFFLSQFLLILRFIFDLTAFKEWQLCNENLE